ncbi:MAG: hypothetical protein ABSC53_03455 [Bacteroidota bacterium]
MNNHTNIKDELISNCQSLYPFIVMIIDKYKSEDLITRGDTGLIALEIVNFVADTKPTIKLDKLDSVSTTLLYLCTMLLADKFQLYPVRKETENEIKYDKIITEIISMISEIYGIPVDTLHNCMFSEVAEILN